MQIRMPAPMEILNRLALRCSAYACNLHSCLRLGRSRSHGSSGVPLRKQAKWQQPQRKKKKNDHVTLLTPQNVHLSWLPRPGQQRPLYIPIPHRYLLPLVRALCFGPRV